jgi:DNA mismatch repair ATPase MutS
MLRTVGLSTVLALAGAPVRSERFRVSPFSLGGSIHILDSLKEGQSHFYAEMARLRDIVGLLSGERPVLFLLDELMHGTNSSDRRAGAEAVLRKLVEGGAVGMVTTHDLALAEIVAGFGNRASNANFEYRLVDGQMIFDYRMRPGVVQKSNALEVMRSLGLDV